MRIFLGSSEQRFPSKVDWTPRTIRLAARSPDLTPCDFFLWGWAKDQVYRREPRTIDDLEDAIHDVISNVPVEFLRKAVTDEVPRRLQKLIENGGGSVITNRQDGSYLMSTDVLMSFYNPFVSCVIIYNNKMV